MLRFLAWPALAAFLADRTRMGLASWGEPRALALLNESAVSYDDARRKEIVPRSMRSWWSRSLSFRSASA
ncbi:MAG: hypothetical protein IT561_05725 [Alphaproteobacteria bacterium]|nr:hypothetical protein [Alphaproteobacteria bacterium]